MASEAKRITVTLDQAHARMLSRFAERARVSPGTLARSILASALDDAESDPGRVTALLDGIPGAFERLAVAEGQVARGEVVELGEL